MVVVVGEDGRETNWTQMAIPLASSWSLGQDTHLVCQPRQATLAHSAEKLWLLNTPALLSTQGFYCGDYLPKIFNIPSEQKESAFPCRRMVESHDSVHRVGLVSADSLLLGP